MQSATFRSKKFAGIAGLFMLIAGAMASEAMPTPTEARGSTQCDAALQSGSVIGRWDMTLGPQRTSTLSLTLPASRTVLLVAHELGVDVDLEVASAAQGTLRVGNPVRRDAMFRILWRTDSTGHITVRAHAAADGGVGSRVSLQAYDGETPPSAGCAAVREALAAGDVAFAQARGISSGKVASGPETVASLYDRAYHSYLRAFGAVAPANLAPRAEVAHVLATLLCADMGLWKEAEHWSDEAATQFQKLGDADGRASAQSLQAVTWMKLAQQPNARTATDPVRRDSASLTRRAVQQLQRLARFHERRGERFDAAEQHNLVGLSRYNSGDYEAALDSYRRAQLLFEGVGEHYHRALVLQNMALVDWDLGRSSSALATFGRALKLVDSAQSPELYAVILNNDGLANRTAGRFDTALALHAQALDLATQIQENSERARSLFGIGMVYSAAGDQAQASTFLRQAKDIFAHEGAGRDLVGALRALAMSEFQEGHLEEAIQLDREALGHASAPAVRARLLAQIAEAESTLGRSSSAAGDLALAWKIPQGADAVTHAALEFEGGVLDFRAGRFADAGARLRAALAIDRAFGLDAAAFDANLALARLKIATGNEDEALRYLNSGLKLSEALRVQASDPELRATSMQPLRPAFGLKIDVLARAYQKAIAAGDTRGAEQKAYAALAVAERSRSRAMQDIALADYKHGDGARAAQLLSRKSQLLGDIAAHEDRLEAGGSSSPTDPRVSAIRADVARLREQLAVLDSQLASLGRSARGISRDHANQVAALSPDVAIISYWLGATQAYAWLQTGSQVQLVDLGPAETLRAAANAVHSSYDSPNGASMEERLLAGTSLSRLGLEPVIAQMPSSVKRLIIIPDGSLHYVSFAALPMRPDVKESFLVGRYEVAYGASVAAVLSPAVRVQPSGGMLLVADAIYGKGDLRLAPTAPSLATLSAAAPRLRSALNKDALERLPATAEEAGDIMKLAAPLAVDLLEGFEATREAVLSRPLEQYGYIHFAVHATTDAEIPQLSSLVLSGYDAKGHSLQDRIWAGDLMGRRFNARTIVLSACDTALGRDIGGEGLFSLRYVALARGAQSVVASLWAVPDRSTATLMRTFYNGLLRQNLRPESALTLAMRQMIQEGPRDPLFWAPFTATIASLR